MTQTSVTEVHPATGGQQGFVVATLITTGTGVDAPFVEQGVFPLDGPVDMTRLQHAYTTLIADHPILRTGFTCDLATPHQVVHDDVPAQLDVIDSRGLDPRRQQADLDVVLQAQRVPFDLARPPLLRVTIQHLTDRRHRIVWAHHHTVLDGWSHLALIGDLLHRYHTATPAPAGPPFSAYAQWAAGQDPTAQRAYWQRLFTGYQPLPAPAAITGGPGGHRYGHHELALNQSQVAALLGAARRLDTTPAAAIIGCWALVSARLRRRDDIAVGVTVSGRTGAFAHLEDVIGPVAATVAVRVQVDVEPVGAWLRGLQQQLADADAHSLCSAADLHTWANVPAGAALYDSVVSIAGYPVPDRAGTELRLDTAGIRGAGGRTLSPLALVVETFDGLTMQLVNDRTRISDSVAAAALAALLDLLTRKLTGPDTTPGRFADAAANLPPITAAPEPPAPQGLPAADPMARTVAAAFTDVLGHPAGPDTDFLAAGGHSMLAVKLLSRLRTTLDVDLTLHDVIDAGTPAALADRVRALLGQGCATAPPLPALIPDPQAIGQPFPLTGIQQAYWAGRTSDFELGGVDSHLYTEVDLPGLDLNRLEQVWRILVDRHPMLRAVITADGQQQVLTAVPAYRIRSHDLRDGNDPLVAATRNRLAHARRDPSVWPLFAIEAAQLPGDVTRLFISVDMLIGDAHSWQILYREAAALYDDPGTPLPALTMTFADYVRYLNELRATGRYHTDQAYWRGRLPDLPQPPPLPVTTAGPGDPPRFTRCRLTVGGQDMQALRAVAAEHGVTLSVLLMTVFSETLSRFTGSSRFLVNVTVYHRPAVHPQINAVVGDFTSTVLADVRVDAAPFADRLRAVQRQLWADLDHVLYSGVDVLRDLGELRGDRTAAAAPVVFTSTLDMDPAGTPSRRPFPGTIGYGLGQTPQVLLDYQTYQGPGGDLVINFDSVAGALPDGYVQAMTDAHAEQLRVLVDDPAAPGRRRLSTARAAVAAPEPLGGAVLLHELFVQQARRTPERTALVCDGHRISYGQLRTTAEQVAARITAAQPSGELVALLCDPGPELAAAALGTLIAGYAFVPLDPAWPPSRISDLLTATGASVVVTQPHLAAATPLPQSTVPVLTSGPVPESGPHHRRRAAGDLAYVIFTSGSTGTPKGVMISHQGAVNTILDINTRFAVGATDTVLAVSPFTFDLAVYDLFGMLAAGGTVVLPTRAQRDDPAAWIDLVPGEHVTVWNSVPVLMDLLTEAVPVSSPVLGTLRICLLSGDWIGLDLPQRVLDRAPHCRVISLGGATEGSIWSILYEVGDVDPGWSSIPYGTAMTGQTVQALDEHLQPCPVWVPGQLYIGGHGTALGYWGDEELTAGSFAFDGRTGQTLYRTGDFGRLLPDGNLEFLGRQDGQVKIRGYRVELREVEAALAALDGVTQAAVVAVGERTSRRLAGFVVTTRSAAEVRHDLAGRLPAHLRPATLTVVPQLPVSGTSKIDRGALAVLARQQVAPDAEQSSPAGRRARPAVGADAAEQAVRRTLTELLGAVPDPGSDLLEAGLTSVDVIRLANLVEKHTGQRPSLKRFYQHPTLTILLSPAEGGEGEAGMPRPAADCGWVGWQRLQDEDERAGFRASRPTFGAAPGTRVLPDQPPRHLSERRARRTPRAFSDQPVHLTALSELLDSVRRADLGDRMAFHYPSAGGLYPVRVRLHVRPGRVAGLEAGVYTYHPDAHDFTTHLTGIDLGVELHQGTANLAVAGTAAFTVFLTVDPADIAPMYGADAHDLALLDAGYMGQLLCHHALQAGLALCPVHGVDFDAVRWMLPDGENQILLHTLLGGLPAAQRPGRVAR